MTSTTRRIRFRLLAALAALTCAACASTTEGRGAPQASAPVIDHVSPARDSSGPAPSRFEWTAVKEADAYSIGVWSEVDVLMWRLDGVRATSLARPAEVVLNPGTYFWSVTAWRGDSAVAESGRAAFVVRQ